MQPSKGLGSVVGRVEHCRALGELPTLCPQSLFL